MYDSFQLYQGQKWSTSIKWGHHWKILMACIFTYIYIYIKLKNNQEKYSFQCFKFYCFQKFTLKKDHISFTLQSNCLSDVSFITMFALFNAFSNYFLAQELFRIKTRASATLNSPAGSHRRQHFHSPTNAHSFPHQLAAALHGGGVGQKKVI